MITIERLAELARLSPPPEMEQNKNLHNYDAESPFYAFLYLLAREMKPTRILEIGTDKGDGACHFAAGWPPAEVVTVGQPDSEVLRAHIAPFSNIRYLDRNHNDMSLPPELAAGGAFDIVLIDGEHSESQATGDWLNYGQLCRSGGVVLFDDILIPTGIYNVWASMAAEKIELNHLHKTGFGALIRG